MAKGSSMRDRARERSQERQTVGGGTKFIFPEGMEVSFFTPKKGLNYIDILPYEVTVDDHPAGVAKGEQWYQRTIWVHFGIGAEDKSYLCLKTFGKRCPICDARGAMMKDPEGDEKLIESLKPKEREIFNVIDLDDEKAGVQLWEFSYHLFGKALEEEIREGDDEIAGFAELKGGKTLKVRFSEKKMGKNKFLEASRIDFEDRDDYGKDILEDVLDLDEILNYLPYDKLEAVFLEMEDEDVPKGKGSGKKRGKRDEEEDEEKPSRKRGRRDEEEPEDDDPPSRKRRGKKEEEEPEEKPSRKRGKRDEEEPEDDDPPSRKRNRRDKDEPEKSSRKRGKKEEEPEEDEKPSHRRGKRNDEEDEKPSRKRGKRDEEEPEDEKPSRKSKKNEEDDDECPEGYEFGTECDDYNECFECEKWDPCKELQDEQKKKKRGKK